MTEPPIPPSLADTAAAAGTPRTYWQELGDAIRGTNADYTKIPLRRAVLLLAVPMVLELVLESTFAVVDIWFVAKLGPSAVATVGLTETFLFLLYAIAIGLAMAVTARCRAARRRGRPPGGGRQRGAGAVDRGAGVAALLGGRHRLGARAAAADGRRRVDADARRALHAVDAGSNVVIMLAVRLQRHLRGAGDAAVAMRVLCGGQRAEHRARPDPDLRARADPRDGVEGAAIATVIGRGAGGRCSCGSCCAAAGTSASPPRSSGWTRPRRGTSCAPSLGGIGQMIVAMTAWIFLMHPGRHRQRGRGRGHDRDAPDDVHADAGLGHVQRRGHAGRPEPRRRRASAGPRRRCGASAGTIWCSPSRCRCCSSCSRAS